MREWQETEIGLIPKEWKLKKISDCSIRVGDGNYSSKYPKQSELVNKGIPFISSTDLDGFRIKDANLRYISPELHRTLKKGHIQENDVLLVVRGNGVGDVALVDKNYHGANINAQLAFLRCEEINPKFLYYLLSSQTYKKYIDYFSSGSAQPQLTIGQLNDIKIIIPPKRDQDKIGSLLYSLDCKIENLRQQNETLEAIAQTLFKHWFVDFEFPNEDGKPYKSSGGAMVRSELGEIPTSWRVEPLDEVANFLNGLALQNYPAKSDHFLHIIKIREMKSGITANTERASSEIPPQYVIDNGDVIFSWSGSLEIIIWCFGKGALNQHLFKVSSEKYPKWFYYFWNLEHLKHFRSIAKSKATTMGHIQRKHLSEALCCVPNDSRLQVMNFTMTPILEKTIQNSLQIQTLTKTRDVLLPKLMSGKLRISE